MHYVLFVARESTKKPAKHAYISSTKVGGGKSKKFSITASL